MDASTEKSWQRSSSSIQVQGLKDIGYYGWEGGRVCSRRPGQVVRGCSAWRPAGADRMQGMLLGFHFGSGRGKTVEARGSVALSSPAFAILDDAEFDIFFPPKCLIPPRMSSHTVIRGKENL
jgi:hypothetical protein